MSTIDMYVVEDAEGDAIAYASGTFIYAEAKAEAQRLHGKVVCNEYEFSDSYVVDDYTVAEAGECKEDNDRLFWCQTHQSSFSTVGPFTRRTTCDAFEASQARDD